MTKTLSIYLDLLRVIAAFAVFIGHAQGYILPIIPGLAASHAEEAVAAFFVLSGFMMKFVVSNREDTARAYGLARASRLLSVIIVAIPAAYLFDSIGLHFAGDHYSDIQFFRDQTFVSLVRAVTFSNEWWFTHSVFGSNEAYWSLGFEIPYYIIFAAMTFLPRRYAPVAVAALLLLFGPKLALNLPLWYLGVVTYDVVTSKTFRLSLPKALLMLLSSGIVYCIVKLKFSSYKHAMFEWQNYSTAVESSIYYFGIGIAISLSILAVSRININTDNRIVRLLSKSIAWIAGGSFTMYLCHQPLLTLTKALYPHIEFRPAQGVAGIAAVLAICYCLAEIGERRKKFFKRLLSGTPKSAPANGAEAGIKSKTEIVAAVTKDAKVKTEIVGLDALRFVSALFVVCFHYLYGSWTTARGNAGIEDLVPSTLAYVEAVPLIWWGWVGVYIFFVISGFVITMSAGSATAASFALGRLRRLVPGLFFFATLSLVVVLTSTGLETSNALLRWLRAIVLFPKGPWIDGAIWTLTVEIVFYAVILAALAMGLWSRVGSVSRLATIFIALFWLVFVANLNFDLGPLGARVAEIADAYMFRTFLLTTGCFFLLGMLSFEIYSAGWTKERLVYAGLAFASSMVAIYATALSSSGVIIYAQTPWVPVAIWSGCILLGAAFLAGERKWRPSDRYRTTARAMGVMTYPLYLIHQIFGGWVLGTLFSTGLNRWLAALVTILLMILLSFLFSRLLEPRIRTLIFKQIPTRGRLLWNKS